MSIIKTIKDYFKPKTKEQTKKSFKEDKTELDNVMAFYENNKEYLSRQRKDPTHQNPFYIKIYKEYERQRAYKLRFEFIPQHQNFKNVRSVLQYQFQDGTAWKKVRDTIEIKSNSVCSICGGVSHDYQKSFTNTDCHEVWHYNDFYRVQKLIRLSARCAKCHNITHLNMHFKDKEKFIYLLDSYAQLNNIDIVQAEKDFMFAIEERERRKEIKYKLDLSMLNKFTPQFCFEENFNPHNEVFHKFIELKFKDNKKEPQ